MASVLNLDFMQTMARTVRESFVSQALLCVLLLGFLKVVVASWRYDHSLPAFLWTWRTDHGRKE